MGDDLALDMSGMKIFFHGQELKVAKEIDIPSDVEVPDELPPGYINAFRNRTIWVRRRIATD